MDPQPSSVSSAEAVLAASSDSEFLRYWLSAVLCFAIFAASVPVIPSADMWWHLGTGRYILQNRAVPHADPFSFTAAGKPWIAHEWLSDVILYGVYSLAASAGLQLLAGAVIGLAFWLAYCVSGGSTLARILALGLGIWTAHPIFSVRPQIFTFLLASVFLLVLHRYNSREQARELALLPISTIFWVNLHGGYLLGPVLILLSTVGNLLDALFGLQDASITKRRIGLLLLTLLACVAVVPLNPNGLAMYSYPFATLHSAQMQVGIMEWLSPDFHLPIFYPLAGLLFLTVAVLALSPSRPKPSDLLLFVFFGLATLRSMRNLPFFVLVAFPLLATYLRSPSWKWPALPPPIQRILKITAVVLAAALSALSVSDHFGLELQIEKERFPQRAAAFLKEKQLPAPLFNSYDFGGYLIWKLYPQYRVYIDGRADLYGDAFLGDFIEVYQVNADPAPALDRAGIRTVILEPRSVLAAYLRNQKNWTRVYEDPVAVIFTR